MTAPTRNRSFRNLFNTSDNTKSQDHKQTILNSYTILGFKGREDFENKTSKLFNNDEKQLKKLQDKLWHRFEKKIKGDKGNNKAAKNINNTIKESKLLEVN